MMPMRNAGFLICAALLTLLAAMLLSCAPASETASQAREAGPAPSNLRTEVFHQRANLFWDTNRTRKDVIMGYNIYVSAVPVLGVPNEAELLADLKPLTAEPYPGAPGANIAGESFPLENLTNGKSYYVFVRTVYPGRIESAPTNQVEVIPRPSGTIVLKLSFSGPNSGFSFKSLKYVYTNDLENDIYLTEINGQPHLASPHRIDNVLRETRFFRLGRHGELDDVRIGELKARPDDLLPVYPGEIFILLDADNCYALLRNDSLNRDTGELTLSYIYQAKPNTLRF
ncbi:MAG: hypothetical protein ABIJ61_06965 [bacterium]